MSTKHRNSHKGKHQHHIKLHSAKESEHDKEVRINPTGKAQRKLKSAAEATGNLMAHDKKNKSFKTQIMHKIEAQKHKHHHHEE